jgi:hypothetical protein
VQAARVENLTACLCCAKIHKNLGEFLLKLLVDLSIKGRTVVFWLTNLKNNGTIGKSSIRGRLSIQAPGKLTDQRDGPKTKGMVTILPWARTN